MSYGWLVNSGEQYRALHLVLSAGGTWNLMKKDGNTGKGTVEAAISPELAIGYNIHQYFKLGLSSNYYLIFEKSGVIQFISFNLNLIVSF